MENEVNNRREMGGVYNRVKMDGIYNGWKWMEYITGGK